MVTQQISDLIDSNADSVKAMDDMLEMYTRNSASRKVVGEHIAVLGAKADGILKAVTEVLEISKHIELVALNARVEAMHAGAAGRGFAVVADEVRRLSLSTTGTANKISGLVGEIKDEIADTQNDMKSAKIQGEELDRHLENVKLRIAAAANSLDDYARTVR